MNVDRQLREELLDIVGAVSISSPIAFSLAGHMSSGIAQPMIGLRLAPNMPPLMAELIGLLYQHCFCRRFMGRVARNESVVPEDDPSWSETLANANQSHERWEDGWDVTRAMPNGHVAATRGATMRMFAPGEFVNLSGSGMSLGPTTQIRVYVPRASFTVQPGYYFAFGETICDSSDELSIVRFYWNVLVEGVAKLLQLLSEELNRWRVPFRFKTGLNRTMLSRRDGAVLYTPRRYADFTCTLAAKIHERVQSSLVDDVPLFTLRLASGFAFAEDPGTQESFGMMRSRLLAQGIWAIHEKGAQNGSERWTLLREQFQSEGISLDQPWLNAGSANEYAFAGSLQEAA